MDTVATVDTDTLFVRGLRLWQHAQQVSPKLPFSNGHLSNVDRIICQKGVLLLLSATLCYITLYHIRQDQRRCSKKQTYKSMFWLTLESQPITVLRILANHSAWTLSQSQCSDY